MTDRKIRQEEFAKEIFQVWMSHGRDGLVGGPSDDQIICYIHGQRVVINMAWHKGLLGTAKRLQFFEEIIGDGSWL